jgi:hypothetical protein
MLEDRKSMRRFFASRKPSPAMVIAFVALLAALSGTAVALPGKNSVDSGDIKNKQVKGKDLANNAVTSGKVKNNSLTGADVRDDSLTGADVNEGSLGQVPSANTANSATTASSAGNADTVNGQSANDIIAASKPLTAAVSGNCGALRRGSAGTSITLEAPARCDVRFSRSVQGCFPILTISDSNNSGQLHAVLTTDEPSFVALDANEVGVVYRDSAGALLTTNRPAFNLAVHC